MTRHILYISYDGMTDPLGQSQVLTYLKGLSGKGWKFSLISFEKPDRFAADKDRITELCSNHTITWIPLVYTSNPPVISTLYDIRKLIAKARQVHKENPVDIVHCRSYISALAGQRLKKKNGIPWIFDMRGFWADERVEGKIWNLGHPVFRRIYRYFKNKEKQFLRDADAIVSLTHAARTVMIERKMVTIPGKITVIPCCVDNALFDPEKTDSEQQEALRNELDLKGKKVLGYVGSIGTWYNLEAMLTTFSQLLIEDPGKIFLFVTKESPDTIRSEAALAGIPGNNLRFAAAAHKDVPLYLSLFDTGIFYINPGFSKKASSPVKQGELMAMGIPVICNCGVGDTADLVKQYRSGIVVDLDNVHSLGPSDYDLSGFDRNGAYEGAKTYFGLEPGIQKYEEIYLGLLKR